MLPWRGLATSIRRQSRPPAHSSALLENFFKLPEGTPSWKAEVDFWSEVEANRHAQNRIYEPQILGQARKKRSIKRGHFKGVSFSKTTVRNVAFDNCRFEDCLFLGTVFTDCRFRHCFFKDCNLYRATFDNCYADPRDFVAAVDPTRYSNIGIELFQHLADDNRKQSQPEFYATAEFNRRRHQRYQLRHDLEEGRIGKIGFFSRYALRLLFEWSAGYGWKPGRVVVTVGVLLAALALANFGLWEHLELAGTDESTASRSVPVVVYYTVGSVTSLGTAPFYPITDFALLWTAVQAGLGVVLFGLVASVAFRLLFRF